MKELRDAIKLSEPKQLIWHKTIEAQTINQINPKEKIQISPRVSREYSSYFLFLSPLFYNVVCSHQTANIANSRILQLQVLPLHEELISKSKVVKQKPCQRKLLHSGNAFHVHHHHPPQSHDLQFSATHIQYTFRHLKENQNVDDIIAETESLDHLPQKPN